MTGWLISKRRNDSKTIEKIKKDFDSIDGFQTDEKQIVFKLDRIGECECDELVSGLSWSFEEVVVPKEIMRANYEKIVLEYMKSEKKRMDEIKQATRGNLENFNASTSKCEGISENGNLPNVPLC
jgi:hypothetical protein